MKLKTLALSLCLFASTPVTAQQLAFPGAEGMGRFAIGGRGGAVYQVTNLQDSGPGSLRACVDATGPRTCVFTVSGDIFLESELDIDSPYITIAGQTAPGQGVQLRHGNNIRNAFEIQEGHVIIRHMKVRLGPTVTDSDIPNCFQVGPVNGSFPTDVVIDHMSCSFTTDQSLAINSPSDRITVSDSIFAYSLHDSTHTSGKHSKGPNLRGCGVSMIRSLISNHQIRNPNNTCGFDDGMTFRNGAGPSGEVEFRNNVVFNGQQAFYDYWNGRGESWTNMVGNVFVRGPSTLNKLISSLPHGIYAVDAWDQAPPARTITSGTTDPQHLCLQDNIGINLPTNTTGGAAIHGVLNPNDAHLVDSTNCVTNPVGRAGDVRGITGPIIPTAELEAALAEKVGAFWWNRDTLDQLILDRLALRQGAIINHPSEVGGWPVLAGGVAPTDTDADGMPDTWETSRGFNPNDPADRNGDADNDGFTNLEEYLAELAGDIQPPPFVPPTVTLDSGLTTVDEGGAVLLTVSRTGDTSQIGSVDYSVTGAIVGADFIDPVTGTVNFGANQVSTNLSLVTFDDTTDEPDETFDVALSNPNNVVLGTPIVQSGVVSDNDPTPTPTIQVGSRITIVKSPRSAVWNNPNGQILGDHNFGALGTVIGGPVVGNQGQTTWWQIDMDTGIDGWIPHIRNGVTHLGLAP